MKAFREMLTTMRLAQVQLFIRANEHAIARNRDALAKGLVLRHQLMAELQIMDFAGKAEVQIPDVPSFLFQPPPAGIEQTTAPVRRGRPAPLTIAGKTK